MTWLPLSKNTLSSLPQSQHHWLRDPGSLTKKLRESPYHKIRLHLISAGWGHADLEESLFLNITSQQPVWVRELEWKMSDECWISARVVIPDQAFNHSEFQKILILGSHSIGDLLFNNPTTTRGPFEFSQLLGYRTPPYVPKTLKPIWARRSIFSFENYPILISEFFLPIFFHNLNAYGS